MDVVVKVIIDEKEYDRLLDIERKYNEISKTSTVRSQSGAGIETKCCCSCSDKKGRNIPLNEIVTRNSEAHAVQTPIAGVLPSITSPISDLTTSSTSGHGISGKNSDQNKLTESKLGTAGTGMPLDPADLGIVKLVHPWYYIGAPHN